MAASGDAQVGWYLGERWDLAGFRCPGTRAIEGGHIQKNKSDRLGKEFQRHRPASPLPRLRPRFLDRIQLSQRDICPSCSARRMAETAAHLTDQVLPRVGYRQWA
jgi:hypothetical protein